MSMSRDQGDGPALAVVVPSVNGAADLLDCLEALDRQRDELRIEVLVPDRVGEDLRHTVEVRFPWVHLLRADPGATIPDLREMAFERVRAPLVAVIEDHVVVPPGWARSLLEARQNEAGPVVIGGSVENAATDRWVDRAAFLCEYSHLLPPLPEGPATWLTGNNTLYDRDALLSHREVLGGDRWENELHDALQRAGVRLVRRPDVVVGHKKHYTVTEYLHQRFLYARAFAGARLRERPFAARFGYGLAASALPPLLLFRILRNAIAGGVSRREVLGSIPLLVLFVASWGVGEMIGAWFGPGDAIARVR